jgi:hypothetical protein
MRKREMAEKRNHPNRSKPVLAGTPTPEQIKAAREAAGLDMDAAAAIVMDLGLTWAQWEAGARRMHPAIWWAFQQRVTNEGPK